MKTEDHSATCVPQSFALRDIKQGEEVSDSYGLGFIETPLRLRQRRLGDQYKFQCCCRACREDYPLFVNSDKV